MQLREQPPGFWRTMAVVGRVSNLPTVWSNCTAGWLLGGNGPLERFLLLCVGATAVYLGGMFLNDAFDERFDRLHRPTRPIPAGWISGRAVWRWGWGWLLAGTGLLSALGRETALWAGLLAAAVVWYDAIHKRTPLAVVVMGGCRWLLYLTAASAAVMGVTGLVVWFGLGLAAYVVGLSLIARRETVRDPLPWWPVLLLGVPLLLGVVGNAGPWRERAFAIGLVLVLWILPFVQHLWRRPPGQPTWTVQGLLAGIVIVDLLAVGGGSPGLVGWFGGLFLLALWAQRWIPAT